MTEQATIPAIVTPFGSVIAAAVADEAGSWRERKDGWCFSTGEAYTNVMLYRTGAVHVNGRLAAKVTGIPGARRHDHIGYVGLKWNVR